MFKNLKKRVHNFFKEFRDFAMKGNVIDMAIGIVIGGSFKQIISSLVNDIIMPIVSVFTSGVDYSHAKFVLKPAIDGSSEIAINYGNFITTIVDFIIIALSIFVAIKWVNKLQKLALAKALKEQEEKQKNVKKTKKVQETELSVLKDIKKLLEHNLQSSTIKGNAPKKNK